MTWQPLFDQDSEIVIKSISCAKIPYAGAVSLGLLILYGISWFVFFFLDQCHGYYNKNYVYNGSLNVGCMKIDYDLFTQFYSRTTK